MSISQLCNLVEEYHQDPTVEKFFDVIDSVSLLDVKIFAKNPDLRNVCLAKILEFRSHPKAEEHLDSFEVLRLTLLESTTDPDWVDNYRDTIFKECVENNSLVYMDTCDTESEYSFVDSVLDSILSEDESSE